MIRDLWHCGWPQSGGYPGAYPGRFLRYVKEFLPTWYPVLHLFSGSIREEEKQAVTIDLNSETRPTHALDLTKDCIPYQNDYFAVVLADPPYSHKDYHAAERHYQMPEVPRYSFIPEAARVTQQGGFLGILHVMPYRTPKGFERYAVIGVTTGTTQVIRVFSLFQKREGGIR